MNVQSSVPMFCAGCWSSRYQNIYQWIQADLGSTHRIESVTTQGRSSPTLNQWVTSYYVSHSRDSSSWVHIPTLYDGNSDKDTKKTNNLPTNTEARYVRLRIQSWHNTISLRFDVTGCPIVGKSQVLITFLNVGTRERHACIWPRANVAFAGTHVNRKSG